MMENHELQPVSLVLLLAVVASALELELEGLDSTTRQPPPLRSHQFDVAAKQQSLNERARPTFYYQTIPASTASTLLFTTPSAFPWQADSFKTPAEFLSGFAPSAGPFGSLRSPSSLFKEPSTGTKFISFASQPAFTLTRFKSEPMTPFRDNGKFSSVFLDSFEREDDDDLSRSSSSLEEQPSLPLQEISRKIHVLPTRDLRKETALWRGRNPKPCRTGCSRPRLELSGWRPISASPPGHQGQSDTAPNSPWVRHLRSRQKRKRPNKNYTEQQYRLPYTDEKQNNTKYNYYEDHDGNDTYRVHHYRHVVENHNYYNASDANGTTGGAVGGGGGSYSLTAAYDAMAEAKKLSSGRYTPTDGSANLTEGDFPDGPHVKHHYYYNEYEHDHRNQSEGPIVKHHYHDKDYKVFYHDHRNSSNPNYSGGYSSSSEYTSDPHTLDRDHPAATSPTVTEKNVKHYHTVKEFHYDEQGRLIDPKKYNYTGVIEPSGYNNYSSGEAHSGEVGDEDYTTTTARVPMRSSYYSSRGSVRPSTVEYSSESEGLSAPGSTASYDAYSPSAYAGYRVHESSARPSVKSRPHFESSTYSPPRPVGFQLHYRDFGDQSFLSKDVNFDDGFSFHKERRTSNPSSHHLHLEESYGGGGFGSVFRSGSEAPEGEAPRYRPHGYRIATRDVDSATAVSGSKALIGRPPIGPSPAPALGPSALGPLAARALPDSTRNLVSRGNIGYILVDPLGELPTIRIHASLVNSQQHAAYASHSGRSGRALILRRVDSDTSAKRE